jgi:hypothetical protein
VEQGIASVEDVDTAIAQGPGLRWALLGPSSIYTCPGGRGGIAHVLEHVGPPMENWWQELGNVTLSEELNGAIARGVAEELRARILPILPTTATTCCLRFCNSKPTPISYLTHAVKSSFRNGPVVVKP